ncbi:MAG TPA: molybdenum cofactor guanylyltransferase [Candidatus Acidoferrum sp.]|nr:molybdenum cofactor guanylyltransferase [Candidatus Acidoferrum sp.]
MVGYVLAGGASSRFGQDKALIEVGGKPMLVRMCELLRGVVNEANVVAPPEKYLSIGVKSVADLWPGEGPLGGIVTALLNTWKSDPQCEWNLIVSCDMPFLTREWLAYLAERALKSSAQVVLPHSAHGPEPLCACYRTDAGPALRAVFERGVRKVTDALKQVKTEVLDAADWKRFDSAGRLFWNMNTAADFEEVRRVWEAERA